MPPVRCEARRWHARGCDIEQCPYCGGQAVCCEPDADLPRKVLYGCVFDGGIVVARPQVMEKKLPHDPLVGCGGFGEYLA